MYKNSGDEEKNKEKEKFQSRANCWFHQEFIHVEVIVDLDKDCFGGIKKLLTVVDSRQMHGKELAKENTGNSV